MSHNTKIINQLRALVLLTQTEEQVARTRISQARTDAVRKELTQNADNAAKVAKTAFEKNQTLKEAAVSLGLISAEEFDKHVRPEKMIRSG